MQTTEPVPGATQRRLRVLELAIALPGMAIVAMTIVLLATAALGRGPLWRPEPLTLPEAAALHDDADVLLLIGRGQIQTPPARSGLAY